MPHFTVADWIKFYEQMNQLVFRSPFFCVYANLTAALYREMLKVK